MINGILDDGRNIDRLTREDAIHEKNVVGGDLISLEGRDEIVTDKVVPCVGETAEYVDKNVDWLRRVTDRISQSGSGKTHLLLNMVIVSTLVQEAMKIVVHNRW